MFTIKLVLALCAAYGLVTWLYTFVVMRMRGIVTPDMRREVAEFTFHLGICAIVALGFLGVILAIQGH